MTGRPTYKMTDQDIVDFVCDELETHRRIIEASEAMARLEEALPGTWGGLSEDTLVDSRRKIAVYVRLLGIIQDDWTPGASKTDPECLTAVPSRPPSIFAGLFGGDRHTDD